MTMQTTELRLVAIEARLTDIETSYGQTLRGLRRSTIRMELGIAAILAHLGRPAVTPEAVEEALDAE